MNEVKLRPDGIIEIAMVGNQNVESITQMGEQAQALLEYQKSNGKPLLILDDITKLGKTEIAARRVATDLVSKLTYDRGSILGDGSLLMRMGANIILRVIGTNQTIRYFEDRARAVAWLLNTK
jgi:hypothetical protein